MTLFRRTVLLAAFVVAGLAACQTAAPPARTPPAPIGFASSGPLALNVASVQVVDARAPVANAVDTRVPTPPADVVRRWVSDRLQAAGRQGRAIVTIREASLVEASLPLTGGVRGYFTTEQAQRYDGRITVEVAVDVPGETSFRGSTRVTVTASGTVPENVSLANREAAMNDVVRTMAGLLDGRLEAGIRKDLAPAVRY